jgi:hypothetical protein
MHEEIRRFGHEGVVAEGTNIVEFKDSQVRFIESQMRDEGFVPALDIEAQYTQQYDPVKNNYTFKISVYGLYVGEEEAWRAAGVMNGRTILRSIPQTK